MEINYKSPKIKNELLFKSKLSSFKELYHQSHSSILIVMDFDFTITERFDYPSADNVNITNISTKEKSSCYTLFRLKLIGTKEDLEPKTNLLRQKYEGYEHDTTIDLLQRQKMMEEWYSSSLGLIANLQFTEEEIKTSLHNNPNLYNLRKHFLDFVNIVLDMEIPLVIISAGISDVVKNLLAIHIQNINELINNKKILIVSNDIIYDEETKKSKDHSQPIIYTFNKASFLKDKVTSNYHGFKKIFVMGDNIADYDSINDLRLNKEDIIGVGFCNLKPNELNKEEYIEKNNKIISDFMDVYDVNIMNGDGYDYVNEYLEYIRKD